MSQPPDPGRLKEIAREIRCIGQRLDHGPYGHDAETLYELAEELDPPQPRWRPGGVIPASDTDATVAQYGLVGDTFVRSSRT